MVGTLGERLCCHEQSQLSNILLSAVGNPVIRTERDGVHMMGRVYGWVKVTPVRCSRSWAGRESPVGHFVVKRSWSVKIKRMFKPRSRPPVAGGAFFSWGPDCAAAEPKSGAARAPA